MNLALDRFVHVSWACLRAGCAARRIRGPTASHPNRSRRTRRTLNGEQLAQGVQGDTQGKEVALCVGELGALLRVVGAGKRQGFQGFEGVCFQLANLVEHVRSGV